jgi:hypothetical protein
MFQPAGFQTNQSATFLQTTMGKVNATRRLRVIQMMQNTQPYNDVGGAKSSIIPE